MEAALRALTEVEWVRRKDRFEARINRTHLTAIQQLLEEYGIAVQGDVSAARSGRYIATVAATEIPAIEKAVKASGAQVKPHRRKWHS